MNCGQNGLHPFIIPLPKSRGRISTLADTDADQVIGQNDPWPLTSWLLTLQWPYDKDYYHDIQQASCLKEEQLDQTGQKVLKNRPYLLSEEPKDFV